MAKQKQFPFILFHWRPEFFLVMLLFVSIIIITFTPCLTWGQGRSLGFKGLVPPGRFEKKMFKGKVISIDLPLIKIKEGIWSVSKVFIGPPGFLNKQGFPIRNGQHLIIWAVPVKVEGNELLAAFEVQDSDTGRKVLLRNEKGEPLWWGDNNRSGISRNSRQ